MALPTGWFGNSYNSYNSYNPYLADTLDTINLDHLSTSAIQPYYDDNYNDYVLPKATRYQSIVNTDSDTVQLVFYLQNQIKVLQDKIKLKEQEHRQAVADGQEVLKLAQW